MRPCTPAELGLVGPQVAGVLPATVALHLLEAGVRLGRRVVVIGSGHWGGAVAPLLLAQGCEVTSVIADGERPLAGAGRQMSGWRARAVDGGSRVTSVTLVRDDATVRMPCDALVIAAPGRPLRNVDGAVLPASRGVTFVQPEDMDFSVAEVVAAGRAAAALLAVPPPAMPAPAPAPAPARRSSEVA